LGVALLGAERPVWIRGNFTMIFRAIRNPVENAIGHTPSGTTVELDVKSNGSVCVSDFGAGIADKDRDLIFCRFWHGDRNAGDGIGPGLAIVSRIMELHSGEINVLNRLEGGVVFTLLLSLAH
jgi:signal transduction histidine kinase